MGQHPYKRLVADLACRPVFVREPITRLLARRLDLEPLVNRVLSPTKEVVRFWREPVFSADHEESSREE
jgi:hypothetical protein